VNISECNDIEAALGSTQNIIHLAAASGVDDSWSTVLQSNIIGTYNILEAARQNEVERVVLASTNHVLGMYEQEHRPALYERGYNLLLNHETPPRPDSHYAVSKLCNEGHARYYVGNYEYPKRVYVLRLGSIRDEENDHPYADAEQGVRRGDWERDSGVYQQKVKRMKATWQSRCDVAHMVECCLADETVTYDVFYGISDNDRRWFDIEHARKIIEYRPQNNGEKWSEPPTD
jgi:nucleoside-diphosphate-sugar epimerase